MKISVDGNIIENRTAQYVAVNDSSKDLVVAMADMSIFMSPKLTHSRTSVLTKACKWAVIDANWHPLAIRSLISELRSENISIAYEPVSVPKSTGIFESLSDQTTPQALYVYPLHRIDLTTPNQHELAAMWAAAKSNGLFEAAEWWKVIDALGIPSSGARDRFVALTDAKLTDEGIPLQSVQLLPYIPKILTKLGPDGVLLTELLKPQDARLRDPGHAPFILSRCQNGLDDVGGVYMRLFRPVQVVEDIVSVNGVGDTFLGVIMAGLARGLPLDADLINIAQRGAVMTLRSEQAVNSNLGILGEDLDMLVEEKGV